MKIKSEHPMELGRLVIAQRDTTVCEVGEAGVCYHYQENDQTPLWFLIFESGGFGGFSLEEIAKFARVLGLSVGDSYSYQNVNQLIQDYRAGSFKYAFTYARSPTLKLRQLMIE